LSVFLAVLIVLPSCSVPATGDEAPPPSKAEEKATEPALSPEEQAAQDLLDRAKREWTVKQQQECFRANQHFKVGKAHFEMGDWHSALRHFQKAVESDPNHKDAQEYLQKTRSLLNIRKGAFPQLLDHVKRQRSVAIEAHKLKLANLFAQAKALFEARRYGEAIHLFRQVEAKADYLSPMIDVGKTAEDASLYIRKAREAIEQQQRRERQERLRRAKEESDRLSAGRQKLLDQRIQALYKQAETLFEGRRYTEARKLCHQILREDPSDGAAEALGRKAAEARQREAVELAVTRREIETERHWEGLRAITAPQTELVYMPRERFELVRNRRAEVVLLGEEREEAPWELQVRDKLNRNVSFDFVDTPLQDVLAFLGSLADLTIILDTEAIKDGAPNVTLRVNDMRLGTALNWICKLAGLKYALREEAIFVSEPGRLHDRTVLRVYDITDLTMEIKHFKGRQRALATGSGHGAEAQGLGGIGENFWGDFDEEEDDDERFTGDALIEFIQRIIGSGSWPQQDEFGDPISRRDGGRESKGEALADIIGIAVGGRTYLAMRGKE